MNNGNSGDYYLRRAGRQMRLAEAATSSDVRDIHRELTQRYLKLAEAVDGRQAHQPILRLVV